MTSASKTFVMAGFAAALALPGFAQEAPTNTSPMSCSEFLTLSSTEMAMAISAVRVKGSGDTGFVTANPPPVDATNDGRATSDPATGTDTNNLATVPAAEAVATNDGRPTTEPNILPSEDGAVETVDEMGTQELANFTVAQCQGNPDMMIADVMVMMTKM